MTANSSDQHEIPGFSSACTSCTCDGDALRLHARRGGQFRGSAATTGGKQQENSQNGTSTETLYHTNASILPHPSWRNALAVPYGTFTLQA